MDVYAVGDIATYPYGGPGGDGKFTRIEHWNVAQNAGRAAAQHIVNPSSPAPAFIPVFWSALGSQLRYCGNSAPSVGGWDDLVLHGDLEQGKFIAYYTPRRHRRRGRQHGHGPGRDAERGADASGQDAEQIHARGGIRRVECESFRLVGGACNENDSHE
ncbi:hypothetical protein NLG97_g1428 [Lecanicillium saksenae]|uniref:Uncharacterized protein n=1 Tax=Lecanicillium saksenae TaxID=468837 RepID=A0ACC1R3U3_9HYPO|nr:hypothetical protein NLG97_g1428 [Lecanicillium saksenae]